MCFRLGIFRVQAANFNAVQLAIVAVFSQLAPRGKATFTILSYGAYTVVDALQGLCEWRDRIARADDESTGYVLPNKTLLEIGRYFTSTYPGFWI